MKFTRASLALTTAFALGVGGCTSTSQDDQEELQALLHDLPLTTVPPGQVGREAAAIGDLAEASGPPDGAWNFDDCTSFRTNLADSTFDDNTAFRSVGVTCAPGLQGQGVALAVPEDIVYVPDQPSFTFERGVTVAGWFKPTTTGGTRTLFRKRDKDTSSFALLLNAGKFQFVASLGEGRAISVTSPKKAKAGAFQHVAGTYDGTTLRLYVDGLEVTNFAVPGTIPPGPGPLLMGNDGSERRFNGIIDNTLFATHALTADEIQQLTCFPQLPSMVVTPTNIPPTAPGVPVAIDVAVTNHNPPACRPITFQLFDFDGGSGLVLDPPPFTPVFSAPVASGTTGHLTVTATATDAVEPGSTLFIQFQVSEPTTGFFAFSFIPFAVGEPAGCHVSTPRELMIKNVSVVDDPVRTTFEPKSVDPRNGVWTFKHLVESMAPTPADAPAMVEAMLTTFAEPQTINGFTVDIRKGMRAFILDGWPRTSDGALDLAQAPFRLLAVVNRFDLRNLGNGDAGEGRFVFGFTTPFAPLQATMIFEYKLPATTDDDVLSWARSFHALGALPFGEDYNAALQSITERFAGRGARPGHENDSAINAVRTNEIDFGSNGLWEMREFALSPTSGFLEPATVKLTPDRSFNFSDTLAQYMSENQAAIIAETHTVPDQFNGQPFQAGAIFNDLGTWFAPGVDNEARHHFALNTCNGCHSTAETNTGFLQISPRFPGSEASLSAFLTGTTVFDPVTNVPRTLNDLGRRNADLKAIVCSGSGATLRKGISRVH